MSVGLDLTGAETPNGRVREGVVEGGERFRVGDVEVEALVEPFVGNRDSHAVGRLAPEKRDLEPVAGSSCELFPIVNSDC